MKKAFLLIFVLLVLVGCNNNIQNNPREIMESYIEENFSSASILSQKSVKNFYLALVENDDVVSLIIFEDIDGEYKYFGKSSYDKNKDKYGTYVFKQNDNLVIMYSKNEQSDFKNLEINYKNIDNADEQLKIIDKISEMNFIKVYILPSNYHMDSIKINAL